MPQHCTFDWWIYDNNTTTSYIGWHFCLYPRVLPSLLQTPNMTILPQARIHSISALSDSLHSQMPVFPHPLTSCLLATLWFHIYVCLDWSYNMRYIIASFKNKKSIIAQLSVSLLNLPLPYQTAVHSSRLCNYNSSQRHKPPLTPTWLFPGKL